MLLQACSKNVFLWNELRTLYPEFLLWHSGLRIWHCLCSGLGHCWGIGFIPGPARWIKDLALLQLWHRLLLQLTFNPWPGNLHMPWMWQKKNEKQKTKTTLYPELGNPICQLLSLCDFPHTFQSLRNPFSWFWLQRWILSCLHCHCFPWMTLPLSQSRKTRVKK